ncbi:peptidoglycan DD-metalloendopeptidase family protein [Pedobacter xixiisoli]|uniref:Peptidase family M23 n=1 Tax=Pedobacter xixiisoli TaxID=1476464 RepID=A0A286A0P3_9SPHI|nr:peptidoglycan DD-metalloendopeptidase family protein [Pedobacter xixiisoli]SOD15476.1 Peptidase family M23 [Pedobacter xixiisoli]
MNKLSKAILVLTICANTFTLNAQDRELTVSSKRNEDKSVTLTAEKTSPGTYTVVLNFRELTNTHSVSDPTYKVKHSGGNFLTLTPSNRDQSIGYAYSYSYIRGELNPKYNPLFVYALPYGKGKKVRATEANFLNATYFGSTTPDDWKSYRFYTEEIDTVTAVRKGIVVSVSDLYDEDTKDLKYTSKVNTIVIEHADGTLANYRGFKKGIFVKQGQTVFPGTALGMNNITNERYGISLMITYLKSADIGAAKKNTKESKSLYGFVTPYFCTTANANGILTNQKYYTSAITPEIIQKEMTKKEIKNLGKK